MCVICDDVGEYIFIRGKPICETCAYAIVAKILRKIVEVRVK